MYYVLKTVEATLGYTRKIIGGLRQIPDGRGLDYGLDQHDPVESCLPADLIANDIDTSAEYMSANEDFQQSKLSD